MQNILITCVVGENTLEDTVQTQYLGLKEYLAKCRTLYGRLLVDECMTSIQYDNATDVMTLHGEMIRDYVITVRPA